MKYFLVLIICFISKGFILAQNEQIFFTHKNSRPYTASIINDRLVVANVDINTYDQPEFGTTFYAFDLELNILDSFDITEYYGFNSGIVNSIVRMDDTTLIASLSCFHCNFPLHSKGVILSINKYLKIKSDLLLNFSSLQSIRGINKLNDSLMIISSAVDMENSDTTYPKLYVYNYRDNMIINELEYKNLAKKCFFRDLSIINNRYVVSGEIWSLSYGFYKAYHILDSNFTYVRAVDPSIGGRVHRPVQSLGYYNSRFYSINMLNGPTWALTKFDADMNLVKMDTFNTGPGVSDPVIYGEGCADYYTMDSIYVATGQYYMSDFHINQYEQDGNSITNGISMYNIDTAGNINWQLLIRQDSVFYWPWETVAIPGGGAFILSEKYDQRLGVGLHHYLSIIKIDSDGNFVGEKELDFLAKQLKLYPNPVEDFVNIFGLESHENISILISDLNGRNIRETYLGGARKINCAGLAKGTYLINVFNEENRLLGSQKLIKQ